METPKLRRVPCYGQYEDEPMCLGCYYEFDEDACLNRLEDQDCTLDDSGNPRECIFVLDED